MLRTVSTLRAAAWLVAGQAAGLAVLTLFYLVELVVAPTSSYAAAATSTVFVALAAAGLVLCARGLAQRRRWARSPVLVLQILTMPVAIGLIQGGVWYVGGPLLVWALAVVVLLFAPATNAALRTGEAPA